ncbi:MAG: NAD-dependent epimerase/dehydratase family protein [Phycisphaerales bacterium]
MVEASTSHELSRAYAGRRVVVTGGAGFIGSHLVDALVAFGAHVVAFDDLSNGSRDNLTGACAAGATLVVGDLRDDAALRETIAGSHVVFHQAAIASVPRSVEEPVAYVDVNAGGTMAALDAARDGGVRTFVYAGSSSFYGDRPGFPRRESMAPDIRSPYAAAKGAGEFSVRAYAQCFDFDAVTLRYFNIFGPRQRPDSPYAAVIPRFATAMLRGEPIRVFGDGKQTRDFTYVDNAVHANLLAGAGERFLRGETVNVAAGAPRTVLDLVARLEALIGVPAKIEHAEARRGEVRDSAACIDAARELLNYEPVADFDVGLARTVDWCRAWHEASA